MNPNQEHDMTNFTKRDLLAPSGFPELSVAESVAFRDVIGIIQHEYELAGYTPLITSLVERPIILAAKSGGEISTQIYGLRLLNPSAEGDDSKDLALRFDHTVPLARFVASHVHELQFPFRRYAIGSSFRGERPKDGRYREFTQADIDIIGHETLDLLHEAEMVAVIVRVFNRLKIGNFTIRIGHRKVLQGLLEAAGLHTEAAQTAALGEIDRLEKIGTNAVRANLTNLGISPDAAEQLLETLMHSDLSKISSTLAREGTLLAEGLAELQQVLEGVTSYGIDPSRYRVDLTIARGLAYYTGTVYETRLDDHPALGSIASGGRYENLASVFTDKKLPGVGISIGVTRLLKRLIQAGLYPAERKTVARVLVTRSDDSLEARRAALKVSALLRDNHIATETYLEPAKLGKQIKSADVRGFQTILVVHGTTEMDNQLTLRTMSSGDEHVIALEDLISKVAATQG